MLHLLTHSVPLKWNLLLCVLVVFETAVASFQVQTMQHLTSQTQDRHLHCQQLRLQHNHTTDMAKGQQAFKLIASLARPRTDLTANAT